MRTLLALVFSAFGLAFFVGCGKSSEEKTAEQAIESATGHKADVDLAKDGMTLTGKTEDGKKFAVSSGSKTKIPAKFPKDVLLYSPAVAITALETDNGFSVVLSSSDDKEKIVSAYKKEMPAKGWTQGAAMDMGPQTILQYKKGNSTVAVAVMDSGDGKKAITVTVDTGEE